jgi:glycosyltransferase involved in cell wall biosynthesis
MSLPVICVNSTLAGQSSLITAGEVAPLHNWGFWPVAGDQVLCHHLNRYELILRARLGGLDIVMLGQLLWHLLRGYRRIYLVTFPDVGTAVPLLKKLFPALRIVLWVWTARDVATHHPVLKHCDHIFCLTEGAVSALDAAGLGERATLQFWGVDPTYYRSSADEPELTYDVAFFGQTLRDVEIAARAATEGGFRVVTTASVFGLRNRGEAAAILRSRVAVKNPGSHQEVIELFRRCGVSWIPLLAGDEYPTGYTNLAESLLVGTPVVIADCSVLPRKVLELPGVYRYRVGDVADFIVKTRAALSAGAFDRDFRKTIRHAAAQLLDGRGLSAQIDRLLRHEQPA